MQSITFSPFATKACLSAVLTVVLVASHANAQSPFGAGGAKGNRGLDSAVPSEAVDPMSGTLSVVATDLTLPGNAGFNLTVQRIYSSGIYPNYPGDLTIEEDSWAGIGWKLHFGRVIKPDATGGGETQIEMGDGGRQALYSTALSPGWITKSFWLYDKSTHTLKLPNGVVYSFGHQAYLGTPLGWVRYVTEIRDSFNNRVEFSYFGAPGPVDGVSQIRQYLGGGQIREINFTYDATLKGLATMTYGTKTWTYTQEAAGPPGFNVLRTAQPPVGVPTQYDYSGSAPGHELTVVHAPGGGTITYAYTNVAQVSGSVTTTGRGVATKTLGGSVRHAGHVDLQLRHRYESRHDPYRVPVRHDDLPLQRDWQCGQLHGLAGRHHRRANGRRRERRPRTGGVHLDSV